MDSRTPSAVRRFDARLRSRLPVAAVRWHVPWHPPFDAWTFLLRAAPLAPAYTHESVMEFVRRAQRSFDVYRQPTPLRVAALASTGGPICLPAARSLGGLFCLLANQPTIDPASEKPQLASPADTSGSQMTASNCAVYRLRPTPRSIGGLTDLQPSNGFTHGPPLSSVRVASDAGLTATSGPVVVTTPS